MKTALMLLVFLVAFSLNAIAKVSLPDGAISRLGKGAIWEIAYSPDGTQLAVASSIGVWLYNARTGAELSLLTGHASAVRSIAFSPDGRTLASGAEREYFNGTIRLWDTATGAHKLTLEGHTFRVLSLAFSPDGRTLASGSGDGTVCLWNTVTGAHKLTLDAHKRLITSLAFSPDGKTFASSVEVETISSVCGTRQQAHIS